MASIKGQKSRHANTAKLLIQGTHLADCVGVSANEDTGMDAVHVVGTPFPVEHNHNRWSCSVRIQRLIWKADALAKFNIGGKDLTELGTFDIVAEDDSDGHTIFNIKNCSVGARGATINANTRITADVSAQGLYSEPTDAKFRVADAETPTTIEGDSGTLPGLTTPIIV